MMSVASMTAVLAIASSLACLVGPALARAGEAVGLCGLGIPSK